MTFKAWLKANHPEMRRTQPVGQTHSGANRSILHCICGEEMSYATKWRMPKRVIAWRDEHNAKCWPREAE